MPWPVPPYELAATCWDKFTPVSILSSWTNTGLAGVIQQKDLNFFCWEDTMGREAAPPRRQQKRGKQVLLSLHKSQQFGHVCPYFTKMGKIKLQVIYNQIDGCIRTITENWLHVNILDLSVELAIFRADRTSDLEKGPFKLLLLSTLWGFVSILYHLWPSQRHFVLLLKIITV